MPYVLTLPDVPPRAPQMLGAAAAVAAAGFLIAPLLKRFCHGFMHAPVAHKTCLKDEKAQWENMDSEKVDDMVEESFPASDPPANY